MANSYFLNCFVQASLSGLITLGAACPLPGQRLQMEPEQLLEELQRATDGYRVISHSRAFAQVPGVDAMRARVDLFPRKMRIKGGVNLRDWLYDGMIGARTAEESAVLTKSAQDRRLDPLLRLVCLRALRRGHAPVDPKPLLDGRWRHENGPLRREWQRCLGSLWRNNRLIEQESQADKVFFRLLQSGPPFLGFQDSSVLSPDQMTEVGSELQRAWERSRDPGDRAQMLWVTAGWPRQRNSLFLRLGRRVVSTAIADWKHDRVVDNACLRALLGGVEQGHPEAIPLLIEALETSLERESGMWSRAISDCLMAVTGHQFGTGVATWRRWWAAKGEAWLTQALSESTAIDRSPEPTSGATHTVGAAFFGLPVDSHKLVIVVDGSGSMRQPFDQRSCAEAAADELEHLLEALPTGTPFNLWIIGRSGSACFEECQPASRTNRSKAVSMVRGYGFGSSSAMYDVLIEAQQEAGVDTLLFLSDGGGSWGSFAFPSHTLDGLRFAWQRSGVRIHCVGVGATKERRAFMQGLAAMTGGRFLEARRPVGNTVENEGKSR